MYEYCVREKALPEGMTTKELMSFGQESILTCFNKKEKRIQRNIVLLGPLVVRFPVLRTLLVKYLMHLPPNPLFVFIHYVMRNYLFKKYIVPIKFTVKDFVTLGYSQLRSEIRIWVSRHTSFLKYIPKVGAKKLWS